MSVHKLSVPTQNDAPDLSIAARMERLRAEAAALAQTHTADFERAITATIALASDIATGGEAYPVGVRETARRLGAELAAAALNLETLRQRQGM
jgi:hypothetical protein